MKGSALLLVASLFIQALPTHAQPTRKTEIDPKELAALETSIRKAKSAVGDLHKERSSISTQLQQQEQNIQKIQLQITAFENQLKEENVTLKQLQEQSLKLEADRIQQQAWLASYVRSAWSTGNQEFFKLVLNQEDPSNNARLLQYYRYLATARAARVVNYQKIVQSLAATTAETNAHTATLITQQEALGQEQQKLQQQQAQRQQLLAKLDNDINSAGSKLNNLEQDRVEIQLLMAELQKARAEQKRAAAAKQFASQRGKLPWPLKGRLISRFGSRHALGDLTYEGITVAAKAGTEVKAINGGRVVFADWFSNSGLLLIIDHGDGFMSLYAHNQELFLKTGAVVDAGEIIAKVGNTGGQQQDNLYFEIRRNGKAEDPLQWLARD